MRKHAGALSFGTLLVLSLCLAALSAESRKGPDAPAPGPKAASNPGSGPYPYPQDSFEYYGPNGLWKTWTDGQKLGRDTWIFWTGGNQKFLGLARVLGGQKPVPVSIEFFRLLDSRRRYERFQKFGLVNEPNCEQSNERDEFGFYLDKWKGDPENYYPTDPKYPGYDPQYSASWYGEPTGIVGLRKFKNPNFDKSKWPKDVDDYFNAPWKYEPPYLVGFSCAFCHMGFNPNNPPKDPERPRWENLAANIGNQYFREGDLFFARGRILFGDRNPGPHRGTDPYDTEGLNSKSLAYHYAITQQPGTSETSRISYDFINNPNTINSIFYLGNRPVFAEEGPDGKVRIVNHVLKDGADSVGVQTALLRVWINIGCEGRYWIDSLYNPMTGVRQKPLNLDELILAGRKDLQGAALARQKELKKQYGEDFGEDWAEARRRNPYLLSYLASYTPYHLKDAPKEALAALDPKLRPLDEGKPQDADRLKHGKEIFAKNCAECHSNKQPGYKFDDDPALKEQFFLNSVLSPDFLAGNTLSDDVRYSVAKIGTNMARALATNAVDADIWAQLSSKDYKALPPLAPLTLTYKFGPMKPTEDQPAVPGLSPKPKGEPPDEQGDITVPFAPPGGGRGYYRTPSLVSMWATAPYFHNNALGDYYVVTDNGEKKLIPNDGRLIEAPIDTSMEGRLRMFDDAARKLLWPEKRCSYIKRALTDCRLVDLEPLVKHMLPGIVVDLLTEFVQEKVADAIDEFVKEKGLAPPVGSRLKANLLDLAGKQLAELRRQANPEDLAALKGSLETLLKDKVSGGVPAVAPPEHVEALKAKLKDIAAKVAQELTDLSDFSALKVPRGTPINLYFNLPAAAVPYAVKAQIKYRHDPRRLAETLLKLSDCPDLVEDEGHYFGCDLGDQDKEDLIEFLKTL